MISSGPAILARKGSWNFSQRRSKLTPDVFTATTKHSRVVELRSDSTFISRLLTIGHSREIDMQNVMYSEAQPKAISRTTSDKRWRFSENSEM